MSRFHPPNSREKPIVHKGHTETVYSVAFSPDGRSVVSGSWDSTIRIWDSQNASQVSKVLKGHTGWVFSVSYSPLGNFIASGSKDKTIRIWNASTGQQISQPLRGHTGNVNSIAFSPDGNLLASGSGDKTIRLWGVNGQNKSSVSNTFCGHTDFVRSVAFSPEGTRIVSSSNDQAIRIWDVENGATILGPLEGHTGVVRSVAFSPDGTQLVSGSFDGSLRLWDSRTGNMVGKPYKGHINDVNSVTFSSNGRHIVSASDDQTVRLWDVRTGRQVDEPFKQHSSNVYTVAFSTSGDRIVSGSGDQSVMIWNLSSRDLELETHINLPTKNNATDYSADKNKNTSGQHVVNSNTPLQDMFRQILGHGCTNLSSQFSSERESFNSMNGGGVCESWTGRLGNGTRVVVKAWRAPVIKRCDSETLKRAVKDVDTWSRIKHKNVHQLMGVVVLSGQYLGLIAEWMENGNLHEYMHEKPQLDRHQMCVQVTLGLASMHQFEMIHGDLKALNVLITSDGVAKLSNFGLSSIAEACLAFSETTNAQTGSIRWAAPELLSVGASKTKQSDIYALGMTVLEIITGDVPYPRCKWDFQVLSQVMQGELPTRPPELKNDEYGDQMWGLLMSCWNKEPNSRPSAKEVLGSLVLISTD